MKLKSSLLARLCALVCLALVPAGASAAASLPQQQGGALAGTVTDPKGAVVVGASVTVTDAATGQQRAHAVTDAQGRYRIEHLPAGAYLVNITATGFAEARREAVRVNETGTATLDVRLELAQLEVAPVNVSAAGPKPNTDPVYQALRRQGERAEELTAYAVKGLTLRRDAATFKLDGEIYFLPPVEGRTVGAVFIGTGELSLTPPTEVERRSLAIFTDQPTLTEPFSTLVLRFTDRTLEEVKASPAATPLASGAQAGRARDLYHDKQTLLRKELRTNLELRTLGDLYAPQRPGFFVAFVGGKHYEKLVFQLDSLGIPKVSPEEVLLASYGTSDGGFWTAFHLADEYRRGTASNDEDHRLFDITHHEIDGAIRGARISANDTVTFRPLVAGTRVLPFSLYRTLRVSRVRDGEGRDLQFVQQGKDEDADFGVIWPEPLEAGKPYRVTVEYEGSDALIDVGNGNYFLGPRDTWYPNNSGTQFGDRATFNLTFRYPKGKTLIGTGSVATPEAQDGEYAVSKWSSGETELAVAGFNYGRFKRKQLTDPDTGYQLEFYANEDLPNFMRGAEASGSMSTTGMADRALEDAQNSVHIYNAYFGKMPFTRLAMTQQPASNFGQAWPTLVYMPFTAFMDATQRWMATGSSQYAANEFFRYVGPHEIAHQWWGHALGWKSYHDQWMSEGFAEFSASLFAQYRHGLDKFIDFWEDQRRLITEPRPQTKDRKPYTVGPVTQGYRLDNGKTGSIARYMIYPKGAYILHMLRMIMYSQKTGDSAFQQMMRDFVTSNFNKDVSTEDFKRAVERHMTEAMDLEGNHRMDWFFREWVYGTQIPSYRFEYQLNGNSLSGRITQSGVSDDFRMLVPVYVDFGKGWSRLGMATLVGNSSVELKDVKLPQAPKRAAILALKDVLALGVENSKK